MTKAVRSVSIQSRFSDNRNYAYVDTIASLVIKSKQVPAYGDPRRDVYLSNYWKSEPVLAGALDVMVKRMRATGFTVEGGRNNAVKWARALHDADEGNGWTNFIDKWVLDYLTTDLGAFIEIGRDESDRPAGIYNIDTLKCMPWHESDFPFVYLQSTGQAVKLPKDDIIHMSDMTSPRENHRGRGYCAISRILRAADAIIAIYDYEMQKLGKLPPNAVASIQGLTQKQFLDAWEKYKKQRDQVGLDIYGGIFWIGGDDPNVPVTIALTDLATLPDGFNREAMLESWVKTIALNLGVDVGELWLIQHVGATKASQSIQHQKALGKGTGEIHSMLEMALNVRVLPADVTFQFDFQDDEQDKQAAEIMKFKIGNLIELYTLSSRGKGASSDVTSSLEAGLTGVMKDSTAPLITRDQAIELGTKWGIFPAGFFGQEVTTVAGMILKRSGFYRQDDLVAVTHDLKVYELDSYQKRKYYADSAKFLLDKLKEKKIDFLLSDLDKDSLKSLAGKQ